MKYTATKSSPDSGQSDLEASYWTHQINAYLTVLRREKHTTLDVFSSKKTSLGRGLYLFFLYIHLSLYDPNLFVHLISCSSHIISDKLYSICFGNASKTWHFCSRIFGHAWRIRPKIGYATVCIYPLL